MNRQLRKGPSGHYHRDQWVLFGFVKDRPKENPACYIQYLWEHDERTVVDGYTWMELAAIDPASGRCDKPPVVAAPVETPAGENVSLAAGLLYVWNRPRNPITIGQAEQMVATMGTYVVEGLIQQMEQPAKLLSSPDEVRKLPHRPKATVAQIQDARDMYHEDNINISIDDDAVVSESEGGAWISGWLWLYDVEDAEDADEVRLLPNRPKATVAQIQDALGMYQDEADDISIDDDAVVSESEGGVWISAWLWLHDVEDADEAKAVEVVKPGVMSPKARRDITV